MADIKWIKIATDIFDDEKILLIESMPDADSIIVIWFKLLTLAGKQNNNGVFLMNNTFPYTDEMLATIFRRPLNTVRMALEVFEGFGMIDIIENTITIPKWEYHQNVEALDKIKEQTRKRVAKHREKQKALSNLGERCAYCGEVGTTIDHIIPKSIGGSDDTDNLVCCCKKCNQQKNDYSVVKFLNDRILLGEKVDIDSIANNEKLTSLIRFNKALNVFEPLDVTDVTQNVTLCNATDKNRKEKNRKEEIRLDEIIIPSSSLTDSDGGVYDKSTAELISNIIEEEQKLLPSNWIDMTYEEREKWIDEH